MVKYIEYKHVVKNIDGKLTDKWEEIGSFESEDKNLSNKRFLMKSNFNYGDYFVISKEGKNGS